MCWICHRVGHSKCDCRMKLTDAAGGIISVNESGNGRQGSKDQSLPKRC